MKLTEKSPDWPAGHERSSWAQTSWKTISSTARRAIWEGPTLMGPVVEKCESVVDLWWCFLDDPWCFLVEVDEVGVWGREVVVKTPGVE